MLMPIVIALILQAQSAAPPAQASAPPGEPLRMTTYYMVLLSEGPKHAEQGSVMQARQEAHLSRLAQLHRQGVNVPSTRDGFAESPC